MADREKMIELLNASFEAQYNKRGLLTAPHTADDLIENGVTIQKWIPVTERCPSEEDAGEKELVLVYTKNEEHLIVDYKDVWKFREFCAYWMPLPEPPKGE